MPFTDEQIDATLQRVERARRTRHVFSELERLLFEQPRLVRELKPGYLRHEETGEFDRTLARVAPERFANLVGKMLDSDNHYLLALATEVATDLLPDNPAEFVGLLEESRYTLEEVGKQIAVRTIIAKGVAMDPSLMKDLLDHDPTFVEGVARGLMQWFSLKDPQRPGEKKDFKLEGPLSEAQLEQLQRTYEGMERGKWGLPYEERARPTRDEKATKRALIMLPAYLPDEGYARRKYEYFLDSTEPDVREYAAEALYANFERMQNYNIGLLMQALSSGDPKVIFPAAMATLRVSEEDDYFMLLHHVEESEREAVRAMRPETVAPEEGTLEAYSRARRASKLESRREIAAALRGTKRQMYSLAAQQHAERFAKHVFGHRDELPEDDLLEGVRLLTMTSPPAYGLLMRMVREMGGPTAPLEECDDEFGKIVEGFLERVDWIGHPDPPYVAAEHDQDDAWIKSMNSFTDMEARRRFRTHPFQDQEGEPFENFILDYLPPSEPGKEMRALRNLATSLTEDRLEPAADDGYRFFWSLLHSKYAEGRLQESIESDLLELAEKKADYGRLLTTLEAGQAKSLDELLECASFGPDLLFIKRLGAGAFGTTYLAEAPKLDEGKARYAVKVLKDGALGIEAALLKELDHPNIVKVEYAGSGFITRGGSPVTAIMMEYVDGETLEARMKRAPMTETQSAGYAAQLLNAIEYLRSRSIFHKDIKTSNVMIGEDGVLKVVDFGVATKDLDDDNAGNRRYGGSSDLFSWGLISYELFAGHHLVSGRREDEGTATHSDRVRALKGLMRDEDGKLTEEYRVKIASHVPAEYAMAITRALEFNNGDSDESVYEAFDPARMNERIGQLEGILGTEITPDLYHRLSDTLREKKGVELSKVRPRDSGVHLRKMRNK